MSKMNFSQQNKNFNKTVFKKKVRHPLNDLSLCSDFFSQTSLYYEMGHSCNL